MDVAGFAGIKGIGEIGEQEGGGEAAPRRVAYGLKL